MKRSIAFAATFLAIATIPAFATGDDDFKRGMAAAQAGQAQDALSALTAALNAGDLSPSLIGDAHAARGGIYFALDRCTEALPDLDEALARKPDDPKPLFVRAETNACLGHWDAADLDLDHAVTAKSFPLYHAWFADYLFARGEYAKASAHYLKAYSSIPNSAGFKGEILLWAELSAARAGTFDLKAYQADRAKLNNMWEFDAWAFNMIEGKTSDKDVPLEFPDHPPGGCTLKFAVAEWRLAHNDTTGVKELLQKVIDTCPQSPQQNWSRHELERLK